MNQSNYQFIKNLSKRNFLVTETEHRSFWKDARIRFFKNKASVVSLFIIILMVVFAVFGGLFAEWSNEEIDWSLLGKVKELGGPSIENGHYFGVDELGRDLYARVVQGSRVSLSVAFLSAVFAIIIGAIAGAVSGYYGGRIDAALLGLSEISVSIPYIIFFVVWQAFFGRGMFQLLLVLALINWGSGYLIIRGQVLVLRNKEFVDAARLLGLSNFTILFRHIMPNVLGLIIINASLIIPQLILTESLVSFLGVGIQEPDTSWGALIAEGAQTMQYGTLWQLSYPAFFFAITQISLYYIGDGLRDAFDPKER